MTHDDLVKRAERWLRNSCKCRVVFIDKTASYCDEIPDAVGWRPNGDSIMVECKISIKDWLADQRKDHRRRSGIGTWRWYLTPKGLLTHRELPEHWGLIEVCGKMIRKIHEPKKQPFRGRRSRQELAFLVSMYRRVEYALRCRNGDTLEDTAIVGMVNEAIEWLAYVGDGGIRPKGVDYLERRLKSWVRQVRPESNKEK